MSDKYASFRDFLEKCHSLNRFRTLKDFDNVTSSRIYHEGKEYINFSSNDYLGLSSSSELEDKNRHHSGSTASRLVCGNSSVMSELERKLAEWKGSESALLFNSGYQANSTIIPAVADRKSIIFSDKLNHASIIDGIKLSGAKLVRYQHNDMIQLEALLKKYASENCKRLIISETLFSMDGDFSDIKKITELASKYDCLTYIDDAHGSGLSGKKGIGPAEGFIEKIDFYISTFGKALGSFGAYCCCSQLLKDYLINSSRGLIFSTALPPTVIQTNLKAVKLIQTMNRERKQLSMNISTVRKFLKSENFQTIESTSPIIPIITGTEENTLALSKHLLDLGIYAVAIRPPTVPENTCRIRITLSSSHSSDDLDALFESLKSWEK